MTETQCVCVYVKPHYYRSSIKCLKREHRTVNRSLPASCSTLASSVKWTTRNRYGFRNVGSSLPKSSIHVIFVINLSLSDFYKIWHGRGSPRFAKSYRCGYQNVSFQAQKLPKLVTIGINLPLKRFLQNLACGGIPRSAPSRQILPLWL